YAVSTAPSSTEFDHAVIESEYAHMTAGTTIQMTATGVSATNNVVDLPEGTEWAVSDAEKATITEDGQLTAKFNGTVDVMLMLDEEVLGKKAINIVTPDNLYFTKKAVNLIYEESVEMPIKAVYNNKPVAINEEDIKFELSDEKAGTFDGFDFTASLSEIRVLKITAKLPSSLVAKAEMTVYLYTADEASFDFDNAAGGDEQLAWKREVSNSASKDNKTYTAIDRDADMVTEYSFAIDMSKIQIPGRLGELVYMLPGSDNPDATAWTFLCDLAERISEWTEVSATIVFDEDVVFDPSSIKDIKLVNDYFALNKEKTVFDEDKNSLTITLNWLKQGKAIDVDMANPLCILGGIKITPKEGMEWPEGELNIVNTGEIKYDVYMRANALYSFSSKPENQEYYGLYAYEQDRDGKIDRGGHFTNVYNVFEDSYTLDKSIKNGWAMGDGGFRYYENDQLLKGIHKIDGYYYKFDEKTGINENKKKYTGEYKDANGDEYYIKDGEVTTGNNNGWIIGSDGEFHYYNPNNGGKREAVKKDEVKS
ncbi:MAG: hypothetical protein IJ988_04080, partial [Firmicutes bacterium]|nr:hypothetical protein [Bacillota bacterium]